MMVKAAAKRDYLSRSGKPRLESRRIAIKRAGADFVVSYWTKELASWL